MTIMTKIVSIMFLIVSGVSTDSVQNGKQFSSNIMILDFQIKSCHTNHNQNRKDFFFFTNCPNMKIDHIFSIFLDGN